VLWTNEATHEVIRGGLDRSPLFSGQIVGKGPRYCPSIEDKVVRFPDRSRHQVFVEPEGEYTNEVYLNGLSSSLPEDVQLAFYRSLPGFEKARIVRPAYAVEYDYLEASALYASLESKLLGGLYVAGQTNGSSGYEEAAAQGLMAGINARRNLDGLEPVILGRDEAYIGVLIDDLVTLSPKEPYRMFTSRAERRLALRQDSADLRLTPLGISIGLVSEERREKFEERRNGIDEIRQLLSSRRIGNVDIQTMEALRPHLGESLELALRDPALGAIMDNSPSVRDFLSSLIPGAKEYPETWAQTALLEARYKGYLEKESRLAFRLDRSERLRIPPEFDYRAVPGLSKEAMEKLGAVKPLTLGQASRVTGVRKSDLALLYIVVSRQ
jgi:NAD/FAD-utilizing enzyme apparently involved in cell division